MYTIYLKKNKDIFTSRRGSLVFLPHEIYRASITVQTTAKCYLLVLHNKKVKKMFAKTGFVVQRKDFRTPFDVIMHDLYKTKHASDC